jgi:hypothetical protein
MAIQLWNKDSTICRYAGFWGLARAIAKTTVAKTTSAEPIHDREDCCPDIAIRSGNFVHAVDLPDSISIHRFRFRVTRDDFHSKPVGRDVQQFEEVSFRRPGECLVAAR